MEAEDDRPRDRRGRPVVKHYVSLGGTLVFVVTMLCIYLLGQNVLTPAERQAPARAILSEERGGTLEVPPPATAALVATPQ